MPVGGGAGAGALGLGGQQGLCWAEQAGAGCESTPWRVGAALPRPQRMEMARFTRRYPQLLDPLLKEMLGLVAVGAALLSAQGQAGEPHAPAAGAV